MPSLLTVRDYVLDPDDPRAPTHEQWERMTPDERDRVVAMLPIQLPERLCSPEGDAHRKAKAASVDALERYFRRTGRKVYLSSEIAVYYPGVNLFAPDVLAVLDVEPGDRTSWVVAKEGKGLDFVLEVHVAGDWSKDHEANVVRYAALGIQEYFVFDRAHLRLRGYRLPAAGARAYRPILPQGGHYTSHVLGLDLTIQDSRLRFYLGDSPMPEAEEIIGKLRGMVDEVLLHKEEADQKLEAERQLREDAERAKEDAERAKEDAERRLAEALAEIERLRRGSPA